MVESLRHAAIANDAVLDVVWVNAEEIEAPETDLAKVFAGVDGILVPGGFGDRGVEGKIKAIQYARENKVPYLGLCLGMQTAVIEFARNVAKLEGAHSSEFMNECLHPVIDLMLDQVNVEDKGGTMRLGIYPCKLAEETLSYEAYQDEIIYERHRHRYEFNNAYRSKLVADGLIIAGTSPNDRLVEIVELPKAVHPWFVAVQFHPEFKSRPTNPHPLFKYFVKASIENK